MSLDPYRQFLQERRAAGQLRTLQPVGPTAGGRTLVGGRELVNLAGNDYLGLAGDPRLIRAAREHGERWGVGARASRLVCGDLEPLARVEELVARGKGSGAALVLNSGFQANATLLAALLDRQVLRAEPLVFSDRFNHASIHHGCAAAGVRQIRYRHADLDHLESLLRQHARRPGPRFILSETVFSMDGDRADVAGLITLKERYGAFLYLDEAHATGVLGPSGFGLAAAHPGAVELVMGTFSKALGGFGAYAACSGELREYLINRAAGVIYATALPPPVVGAMVAALELLPTPELEAARRRLAAHGERVRAALAAAGLDTGSSTTQIVPVVLGPEGVAMGVARELAAAGFLVPAIRPPTVPPGGSRLRLSLSAAHREGDLERLVGLLPSLVAAAGEEG